MASFLLWSTLLSCCQLLIGISLFSILNVGSGYSRVGTIRTNEAAWRIVLSPNSAQIHTFSPRCLFGPFCWYFWLAIQNTTTPQVGNLFSVIAVFISFPWRATPLILFELMNTPSPVHCTLIPHLFLKVPSPERAMMDGAN